MEAEKIKKLLEGKDFSGHLEKLKSVMGTLPIAGDISKIIEALKPKKQKNVTVEGIDCIISISVDNKFSITFSDEITADKYYEEFVCQKTTIKKLSQSLLEKQGDASSLQEKIENKQSSNNWLTETLLNRDNEIKSLKNDLKKIKDTNWYKFINFFTRK